MSTETTAAAATKKDAALTLMESVLRDGRPLGAEYPLIFDAGSTGRVETIEEDGQVVSACAWISRTLATPEADLPVAFVGSVATTQGARGRGFGSQVVAQALTKAREEGAALSLLWADEPEWYQARGWIPFGSEHVYVIEQSNAILLPEPVGVRAATHEDHEAIHALYAEHEAKTLRIREETSQLLQVPAMQVYVCEREGNVVGYACIGRGEDLGQVIHEWGGAPDAVLPIVSRLWSNARNEYERIYMMIPEVEADFLAYFNFVKAQGAKGILAMAHLGCTKAMAASMNAAFPEGVQASATSETTIDVQGPGGEIRLTGHEILLAVCPPRGDRRVIDVIENQIGAALSALPLRPFVWGLDSV